MDSTNPPPGPKPLPKAAPASMPPKPPKKAEPIPSKVRVAYRGKVWDVEVSAPRASDGRHEITWKETGEKEWVLPTWIERNREKVGGAK